MKLKIFIFTGSSIKSSIGMDTGFFSETSENMKIRTKITDIYEK